MDDFQDEEFPPDLYIIRLQGPWLMHCEEPSGTAAAPIDMRLPCVLPDASAATGASIRMTRRFHKPTNLDPEEQVLVLLPPGCHPEEVSCNGMSLSDLRDLEGRAVARVDACLRESNLLEIVVAAEDEISRQSFTAPVLLGIMPDYDGSWWAALPYWSQEGE